MTMTTTDFFAKREALCAVCQHASLDILCEYCHQSWDASSEWVQDLVRQELYARSVDSHERHLSPLHITVDGHLHDDHHWISSNYLQNQVCQNTRLDNDWTFEEIALWAEMGGLNVGEQIVFQLMQEGVSDADGAAVLNRLEHKEITGSAYRRRVERLLVKLQQAVKAGVLSPERLGLLGGLPAIPGLLFRHGFVRPGVVSLVVCAACIVMVALFEGNAPADYSSLW